MRNLLLLSLVMGCACAWANSPKEEIEVKAGKGCAKGYLRTTLQDAPGRCVNLQLAVDINVAGGVPCPAEFSRTALLANKGACIKKSGVSDFYTLNFYKVDADIPCLSPWIRDQALDKPGQCNNFPSLRERGFMRRLKAGVGIECRGPQFRTAPLDRAGFCWEVRPGDQEIPVEPGVGCPNNFTRNIADLKLSSKCERTSKTGMWIFGGSDSAPDAPATSPTEAPPTGR